MERWRSADEEISTQKSRISRLGVDPGRLIVYFLLAGFGMCSQWHLNTIGNHFLQSIMKAPPV